MSTLIYAVIAVAFLVLVLGLFVKSHSHELDECEPHNRAAADTANGRWLDLSERIFDPTDARWLREELAFPKLAQALTVERKRLAVRWLETLQESFDNLVRTPDVLPSEALAVEPRGNWRMLWLMVRFKFLVHYALVVVKVFGPYHRLIPSFSWVPLASKSEYSLQRASWAENRSSR